MAYAALVLASGWLTDSQAVVYTVPDGKKAHVRGIHATHAVDGQPAQVVQFWLRIASGDTDAISRGTSELEESGETCSVLKEGEVVVLEAGATIEGKATDNDVAQFIIEGGLEDVA